MPLLVRWTIPAGFFLGALLLIGVTLKDYGIAWDEPSYFHAADLHIAWIAELGTNINQGTIQQSLTDQNIKAAWHWDPYHVPHPPFSRIVSGITRSVFSVWLDKVSGYRLAPALFFALLVTVMFLWMKELFGRATGLFSALALIVMPNIFGFAHIAVTDLPLASLWFLTAYCFWKGLEDWKWSAVCGVIWGLALATKFPALLIPIPLIVWGHVFHRKSYANNIFAMLFLGPLIMIATQPYLWHQSGLRILEFLYEGLSRGYRADTNFAIYFFGQLYSTHQLPWHYPFFLVGVTTPEPILLLAIIGILSITWLRERMSLIMFFTLNAVFVLVLGLLPGAVLHDGVRQMLPALPFLAALAGGGFYFSLLSLINLGTQLNPLKKISHYTFKVTATLAVLFLFTPALDTFLCHPYQLSYYNRLVGGIRGAYARGFDITYFMEAFTPDLLRTLNDRLPQNAVINASFANFMFHYYKKEGQLRSDIEISDNQSFDYYILLNRRSALSIKERSLITGPFDTYLALRLAGVPLVAIFEFKKPRS